MFCNNLLVSSTTFNSTHSLITTNTDVEHSSNTHELHVCSFSKVLLRAELAVSVSFCLTAAEDCNTTVGWTAVLDQETTVDWPGTAASLPSTVEAAVVQFVKDTLTAFIS